MKNLKAQFKYLIYLLLLLNIVNFAHTKDIDKFLNENDITNYFSGIVAINENQYQDSYYYLKDLNNLEQSHYNYSQYFQYSLITLKKFREAVNYSKKLEENKIDNFESNLISAVYYLKNQDQAKSTYYIEQLIDKSQPGTIQNLVSSSLNSWVNIKNQPNPESSLKLLDSIPRNFENLKKIQKAFVYCYFDSNKTGNVFRELFANPNIDFSRYIFFYVNYLLNKEDAKEEAQNILQDSLKQYPKNLILNQLNVDIEQNRKTNNQFDCSEPNQVIAEMLYVVANALAAQSNYVASNFYLNLANYLNPNFQSYTTLYAENFYNIEEFDKAKELYMEIQKQGSVYSWHANKQIAFILIKQGNKQEAVEYLKDKYQKIKSPSLYEIFDFAEFLKNNENYDDSIKYYSQLLSLIDKKHDLYAQVLDGRGIAYERTNQWDKAEVDLLGSLESSPNDAYVINYLAYSWIEKGKNIEKALTMLRKANELRPNDGYIIDSLGWALFKLKRFKEAKNYLELAVQYMASDPVVNDHYADSLWMNNQSLQARYYWNYVLKLEKTEDKLKEEIKQKLLFGLKS
ncbi:MAG: tetratricopeptide repeat protein [Pelagibacteraceae bacterium]|jgi:tetratricopeptide (TPR) repeat protein